MSLLKSGANPNSFEGDQSVLCYAVLYGKYKDVKVLLNAGARINQEEPIIAHLLKGVSEMLQKLFLLLQNCASVNIPFVSFKKEQYPLELACKMHYPLLFYVLRLLLDNNAKITPRVFANVMCNNFITTRERIEVLDLLLGAGLDCNTVDDKAKSALHYAVENKNRDMVKYLISVHSNLNLKDENKDTPLHLAVKQSNMDIVELLLLAGAEQLCNSQNQTPLHFACKTRDIKMIELLMSLNNSNFKEPVDEVLIAIKNNSKEVIDLLLSQFPLYPEDLNEQHKIVVKINEEMFCMLAEQYPNYAIMLEMSEECEIYFFMLNFGYFKREYVANSLATDLRESEIFAPFYKKYDLLANNKADEVKKLDASDEQGNTLLHVACYLGEEEAVSKLLKLRISLINQQNKGGSTPLHIVAKNNDANLAKILLDASADVNSKNKFGYTPLCIAILKDSDMAVDVLLSAGADTSSAKIQWLMKRFLRVKRQNSSSIINSLFKKGVSLDVKDALGNTMLHQACEIRDLSAIATLLDIGFDIFAPNKRQKSPLMLAFSDYETVSIEELPIVISKNMKDINQQDQDGNTIAHYIARYCKSAKPLEYLRTNTNIDFSILNKNGDNALKIAMECRQYGVVKWFATTDGFTAHNKVVQKHAAFKPARFFKDGSNTTDGINSGWLSEKSKNGALMLDDVNSQVETEAKFVVYLPERKVYGVLQNETVSWKKGNTIKFELKTMQLFYGLVELGTNLVWKPMDSNPTTHLNLYSRVTNFNKPVQLLTRVNIGGHYTVRMLECSLEMLKVFGQLAINKAFGEAEVLSLRNLCGEGTSLTHEEWDILHPLLAFFSEEFAAFLLESDVSDDLSEARNNICNYPRFVNDIVELTKWVMEKHPLQSSSKLCNKLLSLLSSSDNITHSQIRDPAKEMHANILKLSESLYSELVRNCNIAEMQEQTQAAVNSKRSNNQTSVTGVPRWFKFDKKAIVNPVIILKLLVLEAEDIFSLKWSNGELSPGINRKRAARNNPQDQVRDHIHNIFHSELSPTYEDLLAKGYIKIAHALHPVFTTKLVQLYSSNRVLMAPIKDLWRCQAKLLEASTTKGNKPPFASTICDYLRATVLCESMNEMMEVLSSLSNHFEIVRVKPRIRQNPEDPGNKCILVNLVVEDPQVKPVQYEWSNWWINNKTVAMVAEVQIAIRRMFYLEKQAHNAYEIARTNRCSEWKQVQGYTGVERELFPASPLYNDPNCLL